MNKARRKETKLCVDELNRLIEFIRKEQEWNADLYENYKSEIEIIKDDIEMLYDDEQFAFDSLPESLQYSSNGETMVECIENYEEAISSLEDSCESMINGEIEETIGLIEDAITSLENIY